MLEEDFELALKVIIVGDGNVGKSSMIQRFCKGVFTSEYKKTIGVDFLEKQLRTNQEDIRLMVWDTAGQEEFDAITKAYYRGAQLCILVFSTVDRHSFEAVESWKNKVSAEVGEITTVIVQNKIDLIDQAVMTPEETEELTERLRVKIFRSSVKDNFNISEVFEYLVTHYLDEVHKNETQIQDSMPIKQIGIIPNMLKSDSHDKVLKSDKPFRLNPSKQRGKKKKSCLFSF